LSALVPPEQQHHTVRALYLSVQPGRLRCGGDGGNVRPDERGIGGSVATVAAVREALDGPHRAGCVVPPKERGRLFSRQQQECAGPETATDQIDLGGRGDSGQDLVVLDRRRQREDVTSGWRLVVLLPQPMQRTRVVTIERGCGDRYRCYSNRAPLGALPSFPSRALNASPSHGENRGSSPLGSANKINYLQFKVRSRVPVESRSALTRVRKRSGRPRSLLSSRSVAARPTTAKAMCGRFTRHFTRAELVRLYRLPATTECDSGQTIRRPSAPDRAQARATRPG
jgi:hypothetical protein